MQAGKPFPLEYCHREIARNLNRGHIKTLFHNLCYDGNFRCPRWELSPHALIEKPLRFLEIGWKPACKFGQLRFRRWPSAASHHRDDENAYSQFHAAMFSRMLSVCNGSEADIRLMSVWVESGH